MSINEVADTSPSYGNPIGRSQTDAYNGTNWREVRMDKFTRALNTIDYEHHEIHDGSHFFYTNPVALASGDTQCYLFTTPNTTKWAHLTFEATGSAITDIRLLEGGDRIGDIVATPFNSDRNSGTTSGMLLYSSITTEGTTDGTLIWRIKSGAAQGASSSPSIGQRGNEVILKQNTKYLFCFVSGTADNLINLQLNWYEHINKDA